MSAFANERIRVLIVDDEPETVHLLTSVFDESFAVTAVNSVPEANRLLAESWPDVAIIEPRVGAPGDSGLDLLRRMALGTDVTRCIMVTTSSTGEDAVAAINAGAAGYLAKPLEVDEVRAKVLQVVSKYRRTAEQRQYLQELDLVRRVGEATQTLDPDALLSALVETVVDGFGADGGAVLLCRNDDVLVGVEQKGFSREPIDRYVVRSGQGVAGVALATREVQSAEDIAAVDAALPEDLRRSGVAAILAAPLLLPETVLGVLVVSWRRSRAITSVDRNLISIVAQRAALSLHNAQLYREGQAAEERQRYLAETGQALAASMDESELLDIVVARTVPYLGDACSVFLTRPGRQELELARTHHVVPEKKAIVMETVHRRPLRQDASVAGRVLSERLAITYTREDIRREEEAFPGLRDIGLRSVMSVPLEARGRLVGMLAVAITESDREYTPGDLALAREIGLRCGTCLENAALYQESVERRRDLEKLFEMAHTVTRRMDVEVVLSTLIGRTMDLLCAEGACVVGIDSGHPRAALDAWQGMSEPVQTRLAQLAIERWPNEMLRSEQPFFVADVRVGDYPISEQASQLNIVSLYATPLGSLTDRTGTLIAWTNYPAVFPANTRQMLKTMGAFAGVALANARSYERELNIATTLQGSLSGVSSSLPGADIATAYHPALLGQANIGGDFYDVFRLDDDVYGLVIGDVSGKGLAAAAHWAMVKYTLRAFALDGEMAPNLVLSRVNEIVCSLEQQGDVFITLFYAVVNLRSNTVNYASAGHDSPIILRMDGATDYLESTGRALGLLGGAIYGEQHTHLDPGDTLLMYTDGATDARAGNSFLELDGFTELARRNVSGSCQELVDGLYNDVLAFSRGALHDDIALLAFRVTGGPPCCNCSGEMSAKCSGIVSA